jgi:Uma2 family endonuclease
MAMDLRVERGNIMATHPQPMKMTVEEYLAFDRASEIKHEYDDGEVVAIPAPE